jgi:hypothetical protein
MILAGRMALPSNQKAWIDSNPGQFCALFLGGGAALVAHFWGLAEFSNPSEVNHDYWLIA